MTPAALPLTIYRGDTYRWEFTFWQDIDKTSPCNLTGVIPKAEIRSAPGGSLITTIDLTLTLPNIIYASLSATNSAMLTKKGGAWDLQLTYPNGDVVTALAGTVTVTMDVTGSADAMRSYV